MQEDKMNEITVAARLEGEFAEWFNEYRWTQRMTISEVVRAALDEYRWRHQPQTQPPRVTQ